MKIIKSEPSFIKDNIFVYDIRIKCDCGKWFDTILTKELIPIPVPRLKGQIAFEYCPYCGKKINLEELEGV